MRRSRWWEQRAAAVVLAAAVLVSGIALAPASAQTPAAVDPGSRPWAAVPRDRVAAECGLDPARLAAADRSLSGYTIVRYGKLCWVGGSSSTTSPFSVYSETKTFGAILTGMVAARSSLDDTDLVSEWLSASQRSGLNPDARVAHILGMTATSRSLAIGQKNRFAYDTTGSREINRLIDIMNSVIAREPQNFPGARNVVDFAEQMFDKLGMTSSSWGGRALGYTLNSSVQDMSRLGLLVLRKGNWNGEQLIEEQYVYRMTHPSFPDSNTGLGYLMWLNAERMAGPSGRAHGTCAPYAAWPDDAPFEPAVPITDDYGGTPYPNPQHDIGVAWAAGLGGQYTAVHRGLDLVLTVRDQSGEWAVWNAIRPALVALDPVYAGNESAFCAAYDRSSYAPSLVSPWTGDGSTPTTTTTVPGTTPTTAPPATTTTTTAPPATDCPWYGWWCRDTTPTVPTPPATDCPWYGWWC